MFFSSTVEPTGNEQLEHEMEEKVVPHLIFDGKNFALWRKRMIMALKAKELAATLNAPDTSSQLKRNKAMDILMTHLKDNVLITVESENPYDLMEELGERYEEYCDSIIATANELKANNESVSDEEQFMWLMNGLPKSLEHVPN